MLEVCDDEQARGTEREEQAPLTEGETALERAPLLEDYWAGRGAFESSTEGLITEYPTQGQRDTLVQFLTRQLCEVGTNSTQRAAAHYIIGNINDDGLLEASIPEISGALGVSVEDAASALELVQQFEPAGIGARSSQEALLLQLERQGRHEGLAVRIVAQHLTRLGARRFSEIAQIEGVSVHQVREVFTLLRSLNPFPARGMFDDEDRGVTPEISIVKVGKSYVVVPREEVSHRLRVSGYYRALAQGPAALDRQARGYLQARIRGANWFIRCLYQRETTIRKIAEVIARIQGHFFDCGVEALRPMVLRDIAHELDLHESTISRAIADKYLSTPLGVFEFKFFFTPRIKTSRGEISTTTIRERLKSFIRSEDPTAPLSDQALAELLAQAEVRISRRTVTKYRESMGIPPSGLRREYTANSIDGDAA